MTQARFVILGGGMVAGYAAKELADGGLKRGELAIVSADTYLPYERPPLSKGFLAGKDTEQSIRIQPDEFYKSVGIELMLGTEVTAVDVPRKRLVLKRGGVAFEKLLIATGARPRMLEIAGAGLPNVHYLRSLDDSKAIRESAESVQHAVVIGGGFIAMEVAAVLAQKRIEVFMVVREGRVWERVFSPEMSAFFERYYADRGVKVLKKSAVRELRGDATVREAVLADGSKVPCGLVVAGIGVVPVTEMLAGSGVAVENGVTVNEYLETGVVDVYAAGDVATYQDVLYGKRRRVEHWDNAVSQGRHAARGMMGDRQPFRHVPYFFSDVFDLSYEYWGDSSDADETIHRGDLSTNSFSVWWLQQGRLVAAFAMNRPDEERDAAPRWIEARQALSGARLKGSASITEAVA
ncbi:MAG TPA: FAD-dependent oxidoreductase [Bryobacteraceae bacterium]|nr:FAD-dependent oxidoreductase [Bryobacteraceae bacterium]